MVVGIQAVVAKEYTDFKAGSYGAAVSALDHLNHPDVYYGSINWAAPLNCLGPKESNPNVYDWYNYVRA